MKTKVEEEGEIEDKDAVGGSCGNKNEFCSALRSAQSHSTFKGLKSVWQQTVSQKFEVMQNVQI